VAECATRNQIGVATVAKGYVAYHWAMSRIHPECPDSDPDRAVLAGILQRQEPDDEDDEEEDQGGGKEDDEDKEDEDDEGYSP